MEKMGLLALGQAEMEAGVGFSGVPTTTQICAMMTQIT